MTETGTQGTELGEIVVQYGYGLEAANRSPKTISGYMDVLNRFREFLELERLAKLIEELGRNEIREYVRHLQNSTRWSGRANMGSGRGKLSSHTVQVHVRALKAFWGWLFREGYVEENPLANYRLPKAKQALVKTLDHEQFKKLLGGIDRSTASGAKYYSIFLLLLDSGVRISELVSIKMDDLDLVRGLALVLGKGQRERWVPFSGRTRKELVRFIKSYRGQLCRSVSAYVFPAETGDHISANSVQQRMRRLAKDVGLEGTRVSPHVFRHTFATQAFAGGADPFALKEILGHRILETTLKYRQVKTSDIKRQHSRFSPVDALIEGRP